MVNGDLAEGEGGGGGMKLSTPSPHDKKQSH